MSGRTWLACLVAAVALVAIPWTLWPFAIFAVAVASAMGLGVWAWSLRRRLATMTALASEAHATAAKAVRQSESFRRTAEALADEQKATHAANELLCAELACSDQIIHALQNDRLAADLDAYDAAVTEPVPFVPADGPHLRVVEDSPYDWPRNTDDDWWTRLYDENGEVQ
jgi:hypothetical protein